VPAIHTVQWYSIITPAIATGDVGVGNHAARRQGLDAVTSRVVPDRRSGRCSKRHEACGQKSREVDPDGKPRDAEHLACIPESAW
jgi:hypothetical protein